MSLKMEQLGYSLAIENLEGTPREIRLGERDRGRMLVIDREGQAFEHAYVRDLARWFSPGDVLVLNNSKRIPGVLQGRTALGGQVEFRFVEFDEDDPAVGLCRVFPGHDVELGVDIALEGGGSIVVLERGLTKYDLARVRVAPASLRSTLRAHGLPISGFFYDNVWAVEHLNPYYASEEGSVESPLAGLHFTPALVASIEAAGAAVAFVTLHSVGSWLPFLEDRADEHEMWPERYFVSEAAAATINRARRDRRRIFACGSTCLRTLESAADDGGYVEPGAGRTTLYVTPGYRFRAVDAYFTNFHQQQTSMIVLDTAFAGTELVMRAYREAADRRYSFFEFGDAVLML